MLEPRNWRFDVVSKAIRAYAGFDSSRGIDLYMEVRAEARGRLGQAELYDSVSSKMQQVLSLVSFSGLACQDRVVTVISVQLIDPPIVTELVSVTSANLMSG